VLTIVPQMRQNRARFVNGAPRDERNARGMRASVDRHIYRRRLTLAAMTIAGQTEVDSTRRKRLSYQARRRANSAEDDADWKRITEISLRVYSGEPEWPLAQAFIRWMNKHPAGALAALQRLWLSSRSINAEGFGRSLPPEKFPTANIRRAAALLLGTVEGPRLLRELNRPSATSGASASRAVRLNRSTAPQPTEALKTSGPDPLDDRSGKHREPPIQSAHSHGLAETPHGQDLATGSHITTPSEIPLKAGSASEETAREIASTRGSTQSIAVARVIAIEASVAHVFQVASANSSIDVERERREAALVRRYVDWLAGRGVRAVRHEIELPGLGNALYTDLYDPSRSELIEAKASVDRNDIRMALGQLLDYGRYISHQTMAVLTPEPVSTDMSQLLRLYGVTLIYEAADRDFCRRDPERE
jgi:hypothetical protein